MEKGILLMRVVAILAAYNEERFIAGCLEHLFEQGVDAYLIDNESTDRTVEIAKRYVGGGLISIETSLRADGAYRWQPILRRKEELAATLEADWFMHADPDEIRLPPRSGFTLAEAFAEVEGKGYNAVNFVEFTFVPTRETPDHDHPDFSRTMRHYYPFMRNFPHQIKAWKRQPDRVNLTQSAGHKVRFPDLRLYPESFKMRHYPYLSVPHVLSKYVGKKYDADELRRGWHRYRAKVAAERIELPSQDELHVYTSDDALNLSNPRVRHLMEDWAPPGEDQHDRSVTVEKQRAKTPETPVETGRARAKSVGIGPMRKKIWGVGHTLSVRQSIAASARKILREVAGAPDITFIRGHGNIGDHLIHAGTRRLLAGIPYKEVVVWKHTGDGKENAGIRGLGGARGHTALITGSGGWCEPFRRVMPETLRLVERRFERVIVLPSTVDTSVEEIRDVLAGTKALFFARERESYRQLRGLCKTDIAHDCALFFDFGPYRLCGEGLLTAFRTDVDSNLDKLPPGNDDISLSCNSLDEWLWKIAHHETVETDRAHVMIAAAMLGKEVGYRATNYHKVPAIAEYSLKDFPVERASERRPRTRVESPRSRPDEGARSVEVDEKPARQSGRPKKEALRDRARPLVMPGTEANSIKRPAAGRRTSIKAENIVWIFGTARTGSTWLSSMMANLPDIIRWNEPYVGTLFGPTFYKLGWHLIGGRRESILSPRYADVWQKSVRSLVLDGANARFPELVRDGFLVVKDPHGSVGATAIMGAVPESRMILLIRDPRDVVASILDAAREGGWRKGGWEEADGSPDALVRTRAELYLESVGNANEAYEIHGGPKMMVRYEELREDTLSVMKRVFSRLGIPVDERKLARAVEKHSWEGIPEKEKGESKFYRKASPGSWQEDLTPEQVRTVETITAPLLDRFYPRA